MFLRDDDARQYMFLNNGVEYPDTEAVVYDPASYHQLIFSYFEEGYVSVPAMAAQAVPRPAGLGKGRGGSRWSCRLC